jgi:hypothetical protein
MKKHFTIEVDIDTEDKNDHAIRHHNDRSGLYDSRR